MDTTRYIKYTPTGTIWGKKDITREGPERRMQFAHREPHPLERKDQAPVQGQKRKKNSPKKLNAVKDIIGAITPNIADECKRFHTQRKRHDDFSACIAAAVAMGQYVPPAALQKRDTAVPPTPRSPIWNCVVDRLFRALGSPSRSTSGTTVNFIARVLGAANLEFCRGTEAYRKYLFNLEPTLGPEITTDIFREIKFEFLRVVAAIRGDPPLCERKKGTWLARFGRGWGALQRESDFKPGHLRTIEDALKNHPQAHWLLLMRPVQALFKEYLLKASVVDLVVDVDGNHTVSDLDKLTREMQAIPSFREAMDKLAQTRRETNAQRVSEQKANKRQRCTTMTPLIKLMVGLKGVPRIASLFLVGDGDGEPLAGLTYARVHRFDCLQRRLCTIVQVHHHQSARPKVEMTHPNELTGSVMFTPSREDAGIFEFKRQPTPAEIETARGEGKKALSQHWVFFPRYYTELYGTLETLFNLFRGCGGTPRCGPVACIIAYILEGGHPNPMNRNLGVPEAVVCH